MIVYCSFSSCKLYKSSMIEKISSGMNSGGDCNKEWTCYLSFIHSFPSVILTITW